ncbi:MAG: efflux RND transporter permease subunit, partial [Longimicrobiales bacterium]
MAATVVFALIGALILTYVLTPVLIALFLRGRVEEKDPWVMQRARRIYEPALTWALARRRAVLAGAAAAVAAAVIAFPFLGSEFVPRLDEGALAVQILRLPSVSLEESVRQSTLVEQRLLAEFPDEILDVVSKTGRAEIATDPMGVNISDVFVMLKPKGEWTRAERTEELEAGMAEELERIPGLVFSFSQPIELRVNELVAGVRSDLAIKIFGDDLEMLSSMADEVVGAVSRLEGASGFKAQQLEGMPQLEIVVRPDQLARYDINASDVMQTVEAIGGAQATVVLEGQRRFTLVVRFPEYARHDPEAISSLLVSAPGGERVPLGQLASVQVVNGPAEISHENGSRLIIVEGNVRGRDMGSFVDDVRALFQTRAIDLPDGYRVEYGGQFENLERGSRRLM